ncbi:hypothetical protein AVEN_166188-1 [Araneus ventricosus]|uniref:Uncharacterized protein n=1 Tax=Araneus ventricosus TaxID=182803 RepID=A0A4Y2DBA5_ARAVE|nr:hypothetical protein AVEN_166188-1 [Araneus ventricosus]
MTYKKADEDADCESCSFGPNTSVCGCHRVATWLHFAAAHQDSLKVYFQIQHWLGDKKRPGDWGWERTNSELQPVKTLKSPAPDSILHARYPASGNCNKKGIQVINSDDDGEPIVPDDLVETSLSLHVDGLSKDIGP